MSLLQTALELANDCTRRLGCTSGLWMTTSYQRCGYCWRMPQQKTAGRGWMAGGWVCLCCTCPALRCRVVRVHMLFWARSEKWHRWCWCY